MDQIIEQISKIGIIPVIKIDDADKAIPLGKALITGGIPCAEVTFRTAQGEESIRRISAALPEILLGAGTVLTCDQVDRAMAAGAKFIVSPGFNPRVVAYCLKIGIPIIPGCSTPSDIEKALELGLDVVKFFPAEQSGGLDYIKAVAAPYPTVKFMPTGGINASNITHYLNYYKVLACGGSWMVTHDLLIAGNFDEITRQCQQALFAVMGFELVHVGINAENEQEALKAASLFEVMFGFNVKPGNSSVVAGSYVEVMKQPYLGQYGHIAIGTNSIGRAIAFLERKGFVFNQDSAKRDAKGKLTAIYLEEEIAGFAVHLVQK